MAALSVQYSNLGIKTFHLYFSHMANNELRNPEFAETPPAIAISLTPVCFAAFLSLFNKIDTMRSCTEAQRSSIRSSRKFGFFLISACTRYRIAVLRPEKLKLSSGI